MTLHRGMTVCPALRIRVSTPLIIAEETPITPLRIDLGGHQNDVRAVAAVRLPTDHLAVDGGLEPTVLGVVGDDRL